MRIPAVFLVLILCLSFAAVLRGADNGDGTYTNPILFADYPDSEVIRVGDDFYYQSSSFHLVPGNPIMHSKDLVNWEPAGFSIPDYKIPEDARYDLDGRHGDAYGIGSWAPSLRYHDGMFYSVCYVWDNRPENKTGVDGVFLVSRAKSIEGPWTMNAIHARMYDPGLFFDDDGRVYVFHGQNELKVTELDAGLTKVVTPEKTVVRGSICEGSHVYKVDGKYYIYNPGGGKQHCFRSDNIYGPYEHKVVCDSQLTYEGSGLHQGGLVQLENGDWWAIIFQDHGKLGRIPFLLPVEWKNGWPETKPVITHKKPIPEPIDIDDLAARGISMDRSGRASSVWKNRENGPDRWRGDTFDNADGISLQWQWSHHPAADGWSLTERPGRLRLKPVRTSDAIRETQNVLVQQIFGPGDSAQVVLDYSGLKDGDVAGLGLFSKHCTFIAAVRENGRTRLAVMRQMNRDGKYTTEELASVELDKIGPDDSTNTLKKGQVLIRADIPFLQYAVQYSYSADGGRSFRDLGELLGMPCEFFSDWLAIRYCLFCYARQEPGGHADFDDFKTEQKLYDYQVRNGEITYHAQFCDAYQDMSKPAFVWVSAPDAPPNLYLKWPGTSRIGTGIHDAASWTEAFETREPRWLRFDRVIFDEQDGDKCTVTVRACGKGRIVLRRNQSDVIPEAIVGTLSPAEIASIQVESEDMRDYKIELDNPAMRIPADSLPQTGRMRFRSITLPIRVDLEPEDGSSLRFRSLKISQ
ncbi:MAG: glycoside hydrolase 43 family protein [Lentisphaeria bacterium]|nr:glycoside hydrolase 43 family protein [Lentisphaeria bacterium]